MWSWSERRGCGRAAFRIAIGLVALLLALPALLLVALRLGVADLDPVRERISAGVEAAIGVPVHLERLEATPGPGGLRLDLGGVRLGEGADAPRIERLRAGLGWGWLAGDGTIHYLRLDAPRLTLRERDGAWSIAGLPRPGDDATPPWLRSGALPRLAVHEGVLAVQRGDAEPVRFDAVRADLAADDGMHRLRLRGRPPEAIGSGLRLDARWPAGDGAPLHGGPLRMRAALDAGPGPWPELIPGWGEAAPLRLSGDLRATLELPDGLTGGPRGAAGGGRWTLEMRDGEALLPRVFRGPIPVERGRAAGHWEWDGADWRVRVPEVRARNADGTARARLEVRGGAEPLHLDLHATVAGRPDSGARTGRYLPVSIMDPGLVAWLDRSITGGTARRAEVALRGPLEHFPFDDEDGEGAFRVTADLTDATLDYAPGWPAVTGLDATLRFAGRGMEITAEAGTIAGARIEAVRAWMDDLAADPVRISGRLRGSGAAYLDFLQTMPLTGEGVAAAIDPLRLDGDHRLGLDLEIPLDAGPVGVDGRLELAEGRLRWPEHDLSLDDLDGAVTFDRRGITADGVRGVFRGAPVELEVATSGARDAGDAPGRSRLGAGLAGRDAAVIRALTGIDAGRLEGAADLRLFADFPAFGAETDPVVVELGLDSDLAGLALDWPAPLDKRVDARRPLAVRARLVDGEPDPLRVAWDETLRALVAPDGGRAAVAFGGADPALPAQPGLTLSGRLDRLDALPWLGLKEGEGTVDGLRLPLREIDLTLGELRLGPLRLPEQRLEVARRGGDWSVALDGPDARGTLRLPGSEGGSAIVAMERLALDGPRGLADVAADAAADGPLDGVDPGGLAPLRLEIGEFALGGRELGALEVLGGPRDGAYSVDSLALEGLHHQLSGSGRWEGDPVRTQVDLRLGSEDIGGLLAGLGYQDVVRDGEGRARLSLSRDAPPLHAGLETLAGDFTLAISDGRLQQVDPGAGRIFGLLSLANLPRRLALEFDDVIEDGLAFDRIDADFRIDAGIAYPRRLTLAGPTLQVEALGPVDLAARTYDQTVVVTPRAGAALPVLGGMFAGPPGLLAMVVADRLLGDEVDRVAERRYRITGPWSDPAIELAPLGTVPPVPGLPDPDSEVE